MPHSLSQAAAPLRRALATRTFALTVLPALDGTLLALAAKGALATLPGAVFAGLTVIAGAGSWAAARAEFGRGGGRALAAAALASTALAAAAAFAGDLLGRHAALAWFPQGAGVALLLVAAELGGARLPRAGPLPLPTLAVALGAALEVAAWTL